MNEWKSFCLGDVCNICSSKRIFAREYTKQGIPFYRGKEIIEKHNKNKVSNTLYISEKRYLEVKSKYDVPKIGDILLTSVGTLGIAWFINESNFYFKDGNLTWLRASDLIDSKFLYWWLNSKEAQEQIERKCIGTTQKALTIETLNKFTIFLPPLDTQKKIAAVLSALDDKIELNNAINRNLEEQAQAIFKSWFIDFEPFGGTMPDDWEFKNLGNVTDNIRERITNFNTPVFSAVNTGRLVLSDEFFYKRVYSKDIKKYLLVREGDFAYNPARINIGSIGLNDFGYEGCVSPVYVVVRVNANYRAFFRFYFKTKTFAEECLSRGSGSVRQSLNYDDFSLIEMIYPSNEYARKFNELWENYFFVIQNISRENQKLGELRDALLPRLMSGEIDVSSIEI